jgi:dTDP-4-dehydrorhamnose 3,5-epimerase
MQVRPLEGGVIEILPRRIADERGFFSEVWNAEMQRVTGVSGFVQDNHSMSVRPGVLRGLHYQLAPKAQAKLVRVTRGAIYDVVVDVRRSSPGFGRWQGVRLSAESWNQLFVPVGFAHGFVTLEPETEVQYKVTAPYDPASERSVRFDDPAIGVAWPTSALELTLSAKDRSAPLLADAEVFE